MNTRSKRITLRETVLFAFFGSLMFVSKIIMEALPNIHLLGMFTVLFTVVYRRKALIPIYIYVILNGLYSGFDMWWIPYLYIWTILWGAAMLIPKDIPVKWKAVIYPAVCGLHGFLFGILYSPAYAVIMKMNLKTLGAWIAAGLPFDLIHGIGNIVAGLLVLPFSQLLFKLEKNYR